MDKTGLKMETYETKHEKPTINDQGNGVSFHAFLFLVLSFFLWIGRLRYIGGVAKAGRG